MDFTGSNGDPFKSNSLHYIEWNGNNQYRSALKNVGEVIEQYDT